MCIFFHATSCFCFSFSRSESDSHVDVYCTHRLLRVVCGPADVPALSGLFSSLAAAHGSPERSSWGQPAAGAGPGQPQPAAAHRVSGYKLTAAQRPSFTFTCICHASGFFFFFLSVGHWFVKQLWMCVQISGKPAAPLPLPPCDIVKPQKEPESLCHSYPPSSTPQKSVCCK